nr:ComEC/Rec2 family competence protein [Zhihengliuella flava]
MGDRSGQTEQLDEAMKVTGLAHLTAVSGANCALIMGFVLWILRLVDVPRALAALVALGALGGFVVLVGPEASIVRAAVMGAISAVAVFAGRGRQAFAALCLCIVVLLAWIPDFATDVAFQLSVLATAGIVLLGRPLADVLSRVMPSWLAQGVAISVAAQLFCQPVLVLIEPRLATYAVIANLVVAPAVPVVTIAGTLGLVLSSMPAVFVMPLVWVAGVPAHAVGLLALEISHWPSAAVAWPEGALGVILAAALAALCALGTGAASYGMGAGRGFAERQLGVKAPGLAIGAFLAAGALVAGTVAPVTAHIEPRVSAVVAMCDVGQGDALIMRTGTHSAVGVDVGPDADAYLGCLHRLGIDELEVLFISHLHADHVGALDGIAAEIRIRRVYYSTSRPVDQSPQDLPPALSGSGVGSLEIRRAIAGDVGHVDVQAGPRHGPGQLAWSVLWPEPKRIPEQENDASLVLRFHLSVPQGNLSVLATGDIEQEAMREFLRHHPDLSADVLKVAHHGARNGGLETADAVRPRLALIGVGAGNSYGHPATVIVEGLDERGVAVGRTDRHGLVTITFPTEGRAQLRGHPQP